MRLLSAFLMLGFVVTVNSQEVLPTVNFALIEDSEIRIEGTSTLHDWSMTAADLRGRVSLEEAAGLRQLKGLVIEVGAGSLVSGKKGMEKDARKALDAEHYPLIRFEQTGVDPVDLQPGSPLILAGTLRIKGRSQPVKIEVQVSRDAGMLRIRGSYPLNITDYGIEPPTALLGMIKTGEMVEIDFDTFWQGD